MTDEVTVNKLNEKAKVSANSFAQSKVFLPVLLYCKQKQNQNILATHLKPWIGFFLYYCFVVK